MAKDSKWQDEYWLLLMQIYLQKPVGIKPMYSRAMVDLSLELHIAPERLFNKMCQIANLETPRVEHIWEVYGNNPRKLARAVRLFREMKGFNNSDAFYDGVELNESFERDFRPLEEDERFTPVLAHKAMIDGGMKKSDRRDKTSVDKISAAIILQSYLDRTSGASATFDPANVPSTLSRKAGAKKKRR